MNWALIRSKLIPLLDFILFRRKLRAAMLHFATELVAQESELLKLRTDEESARAQLMQLRVHGESVRGRTGFMVSAFIPNDVLEKLRKTGDKSRAVYEQRVSRELVQYALKGLYRVTERGTMHAMIFAPLSANSEKRVPAAIFETRDGKHKVDHYMSDDLRRIKAEEQRMLGSGGAQ